MGEFHVQYSIGNIHQVIGNLVGNYNINKTYVDEDDPWQVILALAEFTI